MGSKDDGIAGLQSKGRIAHGRHYRVGGRDDGSDHTHGFSHLVQPFGFIFPDDTYGFLIFQVFPDQGGLCPAFGNLVFYFTHAGIYNSQFSQPFRIVIDAFADGSGSRIHLFLGGKLKFLLSCTAPFNQFFNSTHGKTPFRFAKFYQHRIMGSFRL